MAMYDFTMITQTWLNLKKYQFSEKILKIENFASSDIGQFAAN